MARISREMGKEFLVEIEKLCRKYNISISHEDQHGAFLLVGFDEISMDWLKDASYEEFRDKSNECNEGRKNNT